MGRKKRSDKHSCASTSKILSAFNIPKTPCQVQRELEINKLKLKPFLNKNQLESLNPNARKGRLYVRLNNTSRQIHRNYSKTYPDKDWDLIGWILASPKQRHAVLKTVALDLMKRTSEDIRKRASKLNSRLTRISIKGVLKELVTKKLVETELVERKRYYWISEKGKRVMDDTGCLITLQNRDVAQNSSDRYLI